MGLKYQIWWNKPANGMSKQEIEMCIILAEAVAAAKKPLNSNR
jgi:hypothetical protein